MKTEAKIRGAASATRIPSRPIPHSRRPDSVVVIAVLAMACFGPLCSPNRLIARAASSSTTTAAALAMVVGGASAAPGRETVLDNETPDITSISSSDGSSGSHSASDWREAAREQELQRLKQGILRGLGLSKIPDVSRMNVSREEYERMYQVYLNAVEEGRKRRRMVSMSGEADGLIIPSPSSMRRYLFTSENGISKGRTRRSSNSTRSMATVYFPIEIPEARWRHREARIRRATLRLLITAHPHGYIPPEGLSVNIFQPLANPSSSPKLLAHRQVAFAPRENGSVPSRWTDFDVTSAMSDWLRDSSSNKGLLVECQGCSFQTRASGNSTDSRPVVDVLVNVRGQYSRTKRSYDMMGQRKRGRTDCRRGGEKCCRHQMEVVFHDLKGFEFILQPKKFDAGFCKGRCPPRYNPAHHHALLQSLIWKQNRKMAPKPCCAPSKLKSLEILHLDEDDQTRLKVSHWEDIEVTECACS